MEYVKDLLVGCDPEFFVTKQGKGINAHGLVKGTKKKPFVVDGGAYQVDGMALEFNIDPAATREAFVGNIKKVLQRLRDDVAPEFEFKMVPTMQFTSDYLKEQPEESLELGCEPDFDAYTLKENIKPNAKVTFRTASGHLHIGLEENGDTSSEAHRLKYATLAKHLDVFLGVPSLLWDNDGERRKLYGKAGCVRFKPYGVEYRTLSNAWLTSEPLTELVFDLVHEAVTDLKTNGAFTPAEYDKAKHAINFNQMDSIYYNIKGAERLAETVTKLKERVHHVL